MEAILLTLNVACMTYLCWRVFKSTGKKGAKQDADLGMFAIRDPGGDRRPEDMAREGRIPDA